MKNILVTGACGQIGSELVAHLSKTLGKERIISTDIQKPPHSIKGQSSFMYLNVLDIHMVAKVIVEHDIDTIFHMAAILSATGEKDPKLAYDVNLQGLMNILEVARLKEVEKVITPSTIAVFGPDAPKENTPNEVSLNPTTMYGITKAAGEKLLQYYHFKYGLDTRSLRYPGIISSETAPGGGTTDFAVDLYFHAVSKKPYACFVKEDTALPFMYMPDAIKAIMNLANAEGSRLKRRVYNVNALRLTPRDIVNSIRRHVPDFSCTYAPDFRQAIADSWPHSIDDNVARQEWGWKPDFDLESMTRDMLEHIRKK
jgi:nucleoside-diphosphate-sugar epimerase